MKLFRTFIRSVDYRWRSLLLAQLLGGALAVLAPSPAVEAHPHVWVTAAAAFHVENGVFKRMSLHWQFDAFFSQVLMGDFDKNKDGKFDAAETEAMKTQVFGNLKEYGYFVHLKAGATPVDIERIDNFHADVDKDGELIFTFDLVPVNTSDLRTAKLIFALFDPTVYVDLALGGDAPVTLEGPGAKDCAWKMRDLDQISNSQGFVSPQEVEVGCKG
jgi:ABC-type uncharacterized transport system substrate-binding protein